MEVAVDGRIELFDKMLMMAELASNEKVPLRLIGGAAMQLWGGTLQEARAMTSDLDWALTGEELPDETTAGATLNPLVRALREFGFERQKDSKPSRSARFKFQRPGCQTDVEFLCGDISFGRASKRDPAFEIVTLEGHADPPAFYAARTPWIDKVDRWENVQVHGSTRTGEVLIPSIPSLVLLKLKAVRDKLERLQEEADESRLGYERTRLQRHGDDLLTLLRWSEGRGEFVEVTDRIRSDPDTSEVAREAEQRLSSIGQSLVHHHQNLSRGVSRLAKAARA